MTEIVATNVNHPNPGTTGTPTAHANFYGFKYLRSNTDKNVCINLKKKVGQTNQVIFKSSIKLIGLPAQPQLGCQYLSHYPGPESLTLDQPDNL